MYPITKALSVLWEVRGEEIVLDGLSRKEEEGVKDGYDNEEYIRAPGHQKYKNGPQDYWAQIECFRFIPVWETPGKVLADSPWQEGNGCKCPADGDGIDVQEIQMHILSHVGREEGHYPPVGQS